MQFLTRDALCICCIEKPNISPSHSPEINTSRKKQHSRETVDVNFTTKHAPGAYETAKSIKLLNFNIRRGPDESTSALSMNERLVEHMENSVHVVNSFH